MKQNYLLSDLRKAAQVLLSAAVKETFPHVMLVGGRVTPLGFYSDFIFPFEFQKSFLPLLEEGMLRLVKSGADFELNEMVPLSAEAFFSHKGELYRAQDVKEVEDSLVTLITLGSFCDFTLEEFVCESTSDVGAFKLKSFEKIGRRDGKEVVRIFGAADFDKQSLKDFLKQESSIVQKIHTNIGEKLSLFSPFNEEGSLFFWRPKGAALIQSLDRFIFESLE